MNVSLPARSPLALLVLAPYVSTRSCGSPREVPSPPCSSAGYALEIWRAPAELLPDGAWVAEGDVVQLVIEAPQPGSVAVLSVDGRGVVTEHRPALPLEPGRTALPTAFRLDDAPGYERFWLVTGDGEASRRALERGDAPAGAVASCELRKR